MSRWFAVTTKPSGGSTTRGMSAGGTVPRQSFSGSAPSYGTLPSVPGRRIGTSPVARQPIEPEASAHTTLWAGNGKASSARPSDSRSVAVMTALSGTRRSDGSSATHFSAIRPWTSGPCDVSRTTNVSGLPPRTAIVSVRSVTSSHAAPRRTFRPAIVSR